NSLNLALLWPEINCEICMVLIYQNGVRENLIADEPGGQPVRARLNITKQNLSNHVGWILSNKFLSTLQYYPRKADGNFFRSIINYYPEICTLVAFRGGSCRC